ncbi:MAG TPA: DotU family type IV/VI secretion system protein [Polyangiaceae bacterium]|jgi:type IV/VI secretion system ImpK/VasF family protein|nr:DotU family type IV/VI secretion system protein [Polyangiaceae bacterium]
MSTTNEALLFEIEAAFSRVEEQCVFARAAELVIAQRRAEEQLSQAMSVGRSVPPPVITPGVAATSKWIRAVELAKDPNFRDANRDGRDLVEMRQTVRHTFSELRTSLLDRLAEHDVYYILFPLVVYADELIARATRGASERWEPLQGEFYEIENGGEMFYQVLDQRLRDAETHPLVLGTFYFCLLDGFSGMHQPSSRRITEYLATLRERFPIAENKFPHVDEPAQKPELVDFPVLYYALAAAAVLSVYLLLVFIAPK